MNKYTLNVDLYLAHNSDANEERKIRLKRLIDWKSFQIDTRVKIM